MSRNMLKRVKARNGTQLIFPDVLTKITIGFSNKEHDYHILMQQYFAKKG